MKVIFMGSSDFSTKVFETLMANAGVAEVLAVVTGTDKAVGRSGKPVPPMLKTAAEKAGVKVLQFDKVSKEGLKEVAALYPDAIITAAFGQILSESFLKIAPMGVINVHASLLPKYRGSAPIQWAIINGEKETGITIMRTVKAVDAGDIILKRSVAIRENETAGELFVRLADLGGEVLIEALSLINSGEAVYLPQDEKCASYFPMLKREDGLLDFSKSPAELSCFVLGMTPWPSAFTFLDGKMLKVYSLSPCDCIMSGHPGEVLFADENHGLIVASGSGAVRLESVMIEGKKQMSDIDFLRGKKIPVGTILGEKDR